MTVASERRQQDLANLQALCSSSGGRVSILQQSGNPPKEIVVELRCRTVDSRDYPRSHADRTRVRIRLPTRYPFEEPLADVQSPVFHPNVFASGKICLGTRWLPTEGLDLFVQRIWKILTFDPTVVSESSPANADAASWYRDARRRFPAAFPTDSFPFIETGPKRGSIRWQNLPPASDAAPRRIIRCGNCGQQLRVPPGHGEVECPKCHIALRV